MAYVRKGQPVIGPYHDEIKKNKGCHGVKTSDIVGACYKTDIDSYLKLIVRKITEKCNTNQELMRQIRRVKMSEHNYVTPGEFRITLIKFGVNLSQPIVDMVFNVFDDDRSGTMDFDEFANWIMNADTRPYVEPAKKGTARPLTETEKLQRKLKKDIENHPNTFKYLKKKTSFMELVSDVTRLKLCMSEKDMRALFVMLDKGETGFVDSDVLLHFAETGKVIEAKTPETRESVSIPSLHDAVMAVTGRNPKLINQCFEHVSRTAKIRMPFDEFTQALLKGGVGFNKKHLRGLFMALGGASGYADVDVLLEFVGPNLTLPAAKVPEPPKIEIFGSSVHKAELRLREYFRRGYDLVRHEVLANDKSHSGWIDSESLHKIICKCSGPLSFADFRLVLKNLQQDDRNRVNVRHFLDEYNPRRHNVYINMNETGETSQSSPKKNAEKRPSSAKVTQASLENSVSSKSITFNETLTTSEEERETEREELNATAARGKMRPRTAGATLGSNRQRTEDPLVVELRRKWQMVLRECQKSDPERLGSVPRRVFMDALKFADLGRDSSHFQNKLADTYALRGGDLVDYLSCFRNYLNELISVMPTKSSEHIVKPSTQPREKKGNHPWDFQYAREVPRHNKPSTPYWATASKLKTPEQSITAGTTLGSSASFGSLRPKSAGPGVSQVISSTMSKSKSSTALLSDADRQTILGKYDVRTVAICSKCHEVFLPIWRSVRNEFKRAQINSKNGCILASTFLAILDHFGIRLSSTELSIVVRSFREMGTMQADVIR